MDYTLDQIKAEKARRQSSSQYSLDDIKAERAKRGNKIPSSENVLQRAIGMSSRALSAGAKELGPQGKFSMAPGMNMYQAGEAAKGSMMHDIAGPDNLVGEIGLNIASDPTTYVGGGGILKGAKRAGKSIAELEPLKNAGRVLSGNKAAKFAGELEETVGEAGSNLSKSMGREMNAIQSAKPNARISFLEDITKPQLDQKVTKLINKTDNLKKYNLDELTLPESQQVIADLKANLRQSLKTGDVVKSDEREILRFINELKAKQLDVFPEHSGVLKNYGEGIEAYKEVAGDIPSMMEGSGNRITRAVRESQLKKISPEASKRFGSYKKVKTGMKLGAAAAGAYGTYEGAKKFLK